MSTTPPCCGICQRICESVRSRATLHPATDALDLLVSKDHTVAEVRWALLCGHVRCADRPRSVFALRMGLDGGNDELELAIHFVEGVNALVLLMPAPLTK